MATKEGVLLRRPSKAAESAAAEPEAAPAVAEEPATEHAAGAGRTPEQEKPPARRKESPGRGEGEELERKSGTDVDLWGSIFENLDPTAVSEAQEPEPVAPRRRRKLPAAATLPAARSGRGRRSQIEGKGKMA